MIIRCLFTYIPYWGSKRFYILLSILSFYLTILWRHFVVRLIIWQTSTFFLFRWSPLTIDKSRYHSYRFLKLCSMLFDSVQSKANYVTIFFVGSKGRHTQRDKSLRLVPGTKSLRVNYTFSSKSLVTGTNAWSLRLVPRIQTCFEFVGQVSGTCPLKLCWSPRVSWSWDKSLRPNENKPIADQYFRSHNLLRTPFQDGGWRWGWTSI